MDTRHFSALHMERGSVESVTIVTCQGTVQETVLLKKEKEREDRRANLEKLEQDINKGTNEASTASGKRITAGSGHPRKRRRQQNKTQAGQTKWNKK